MISLRQIGRLAGAANVNVRGLQKYAKAKGGRGLGPKELQTNPISESHPPTPKPETPWTSLPIGDTQSSPVSELIQLDVVSKQQTETRSKLDKLYKTIELEILAYEQSVLDSYQWFVLTTASHLRLQVGKVWQPVKFSRHLTCVNKSAFVHKKARVHYEVRTYHRYINLHKLTGSTADTFLEYIQRNLPEGVGLKVTKCEVLPLPDFVKPMAKAE